MKRLSAESFRASRWAAIGLICLTCARGNSQTAPAPALQRISLADVLAAALENNRALQIERVNPELARLTLRAAYGFYDPLLAVQARKESVTDSGAFDATNPAIDTGFSSDSDIAGGAITGFLPSGLTYNLTGSYAHSHGSRNFLNFDAYRLVGGIYLQQPLLKNSWTDLPRLTIRINKRNLKISEAGVRYVAMSIVNLVSQAYYDLVFAWDNLRAHQELAATRKQFHAGVRRQVETGALTALDEQIAAAQLARTATDLITASNTVVLAVNQLKSLTGTSVTNWTDALWTPEPEPDAREEKFELAESFQRGLAQRPDLQQLQILLSNAESTRKFRRNQLFPALDLIGGYGRRGASSIQAFPPDDPTASFVDALGQVQEAAAPNHMMGLMFSVPLSRTADRANYRASQVLKKQAELQVKQKEEMVIREISDALHLARFSFDRVQSAQMATAASRGALKGEQEKLLQGQSSIIFVLQFQGDMAAAQITELAAKQQYAKALSQLRFAEGSILEAHRLILEFQ